jgi:hypothetical protein
MRLLFPLLAALAIGARSLKAQDVEAALKRAQAALERARDTAMSLEAQMAFDMPTDPRFFAAVATRVAIEEAQDELVRAKAEAEARAEQEDQE